MRQVTHALLTRPPLNCLKSIRKLHSNSSVRLACVKHAASVHPEPGSNSHVKMVFEPVKISLANLTVLTVLRFLFFISLKIFWNFQGCITVYLSRCFAVVFNQLRYFITVDFVCQQLFLIFSNSFRSSCRAFMPQRLFIITHCFQLVKHFFELFSKLSCFSIAATVIDFIRTVRFCQALFSSFLEVFVVSRGDKRYFIIYGSICQHLFSLFFLFILYR